MNTKNLMITEISEKPFCLSFVPSEDAANVNGSTHGGVLFYVCDEAIGRYISSRGRKGAAADAQIHFFRPARIGETFFLEVRERKEGRRLGTYLLEIKDGENRLIADCSFTIAFLDA